MLYSLPDENLQASPRPTTSSRTLSTVKQFSKKYQFISEGALRQHIFASKPRKTSRGRLPGNGLAPAIVRIGRKVLIDEAKFFEWLDSQQHNAA